MSDATRATGVAAPEPNALARFWQRTSRIDPRYLIAGLVTMSSGKTASILLRRVCALNGFTM